jgi:hypothetical protein
MSGCPKIYDDGMGKELWVRDMHYINKYSRNFDKRGGGGERERNTRSSR